MATSVKPKVAVLVTDSSQRVGDDAEMRLYVAEWRKYRGWNQDQLGAALNISKSAVSKMERGNRHSAPKHQDKIVEALNISLADLRRKPPEKKVKDLATSLVDDMASEPKQPPTAEGRIVIDEALELWDRILAIVERNPAHLQRMEKFVNHLEKQEISSSKSHPHMRGRTKAT